MGGPEMELAIATACTVAAISSEPDSAAARAEAVLDELRALIPFEAAELTQVHPITGESIVMASQGYTDEVLGDLHSPQFSEIMQSLALPHTGRPIRIKDLPGDPLDNWAVSDVLLPAGYREGMTMCLRTTDGRFTGVLNLSTTSTEHPSTIARDIVGHLCTALGNLADPLQSGRWMTMLLGTGAMAVGLDEAGEMVSIPGVCGHRLLTDHSELLQVAQRSAAQHAWNSFVWPDENDWFRVRVVPCNGNEPIAALVSIDEFDIGPLTRRELEVLTLATEGLSNAEIGRSLFISDRTVATHVEHILDKLKAPNRAAAASYALREGLYLGKLDTHVID